MVSKSLFVTRPIHSCVAAATAILALVPSAVAAPATAAPPAETVAQDSPAPTAGQVASIRYRLAAASEAANAAATALASAQAQLPGAQTALQAAQQAADAAVVAQQRAEAVAVAAKAAVGAQLQQIAVVEQQIAKLQDQISAFARATYISGGQFEELGILLRTRTPSQFADQLVSVVRVARSNSQTFDQMTAAKKALAAKLDELRRLQAQAAAAENRFRRRFFWPCRSWCRPF